MIEENVWKITFVILFVIYSLIRVPYAIKNKKSNCIKAKNSTNEKFKVFLATQGMVTLPLLFVFTPWLDSFNMNLPVYVRLIGLIVILFGIILFLVVHKALDKNWSPYLEIKEDHELITNGPYKYVRHPMYTQIWLWIAGQFLLLSNWIVGLAGIVTWSILYFTRVGKEENMMLEQFGDKYKEYIELTGRLFPKVI